MTGSEIKIDTFFPGIDDITNPDFNPTGKNAKSYGAGKDIQLNLYADSNNAAEIYITENSGDPISKSIWLRPGQGITMDYNIGTRAMNIFYATGTASDVLFVICR